MGCLVGAVKAEAGPNQWEQVLRRARPGSEEHDAVLQGILPPHDGPTALVPVEMGDTGLAERHGIEAKDIVMDQVRDAAWVINGHGPGRITTLGRECSVSLAPFSHLMAWDGDDLAVV